MKETAHELEQRNSFYLALQSCSELHFRNKRGKVHNMSLVLRSLIFSLLRGKYGNLSAIHRGMVIKKKLEEAGAKVSVKPA